MLLPAVLFTGLCPSGGSSKYIQAQSMQGLDDMCLTGKSA